MPSARLVRSFSLRMLPLSIFAAIVIMAVPPLIYHFTNQKDMKIQAEIYAKLLATDLGKSIETEPFLWQYRTNKILMYTDKHRFQKDIGTVVIRDCNDKIIIDSARLKIGTGATEGPAAKVPIITRGTTVGSVEVIMDPSEYKERIISISFKAGFVGACLFALLYFFPTKVVKAQAEKLAVAVGKLQIAKIQEQERKRIARDLHDGVGQILTALQIELKLAQSQSLSDNHLENARTLAEDILHEIRAAVLALRPAAFTHKNLEEAIRSFIEEFELRNSIPSSLRITGNLSELPKDMEVLVFRIFQECMTNILKHAKAGEIGVVLEITTDLLIMSISDDGMGFDPSDCKTGTGIRGIKERLELCGGNMKIDTTELNGTSLTFSIPLHGAGINE
jgi:signal transduction histidine kinase